MLISGNNNLSQLKIYLEAAYSCLIAEQDARAIFEQQKEAIETNWDSVCDEAQLSVIDRKLFSRPTLNKEIYLLIYMGDLAGILTIASQEKPIKSLP